MFQFQNFLRIHSKSISKTKIAHAIPFDRSINNQGLQGKKFKESYNQYIKKIKNFPSQKINNYKQYLNNSSLFSLTPKTSPQKIITPTKCFKFIQDNQIQNQQKNRQTPKQNQYYSNTQNKWKSLHQRANSNSIHQIELNFSKDKGSNIQQKNKKTIKNRPYTAKSQKYCQKISKNNSINQNLKSVQITLNHYFKSKIKKQNILFKKSNIKFRRSHNNYIKHSYQHTDDILIQNIQQKLKIVKSNTKNIQDIIKEKCYNNSID